MELPGLCLCCYCGILNGFGSPRPRYGAIQPKGTDWLREWPATFECCLEHPEVWWSWLWEIQQISKWVVISNSETVDETGCPFWETPRCLFWVCWLILIRFMNLKIEWIHGSWQRERFQRGASLEPASPMPAVKDGCYSLSLPLFLCLSLSLSLSLSVYL